MHIDWFENNTDYCIRKSIGTCEFYIKDSECDQLYLIKNRLVVARNFLVSNIFC